MPDPVGTVSQLVSIIRSQLTAIENPTANARLSLTRVKNKQSDTTKNIDTLIGQRVKSIDQNDPQRGRKAFRIFLESILLSHFGENLINDPKFYQMVDDIQNAMENDPVVQSQINTAITHLLSA